MRGSEGRAAILEAGLLTLVAVVVATARARHGHPPLGPHDAPGPTAFWVAAMVMSGLREVLERRLAPPDELGRHRALDVRLAVGALTASLVVPAVLPGAMAAGYLERLLFLSVGGAKALGLLHLGWRAALSSVPVRPLHLALAGAPLLVLCSIYQATVQPTQGDESSYLLVAHSLIDDGDLDLANNYEERAYWAYHWSELPPQPGRRAGSGELVSFHGVAFSLIAAPAYALGGRLGVLLLLNALGALVALSVRRLVGLLGGSPWAGATAWAVCHVSVPIATYAGQVYPEILAAALVCWVLVGCLEGRRGPRWYGAASVALILLIALKIRYGPAALALLLLLLLGGRRERRALLFLGPALAAGLAALVMVDLWLVEGTIVVERFGRNASYTLSHFRLRGILRGLPGIFFDQEYGLILYAPVFLWLPAGLVAARERRWGAALRLALPLVAQVGAISAWARWDGAFSPAGRYLVCVWPLAVVLAALGWDRTRRGVGAPLLRWAMVWTTASYSLLAAAPSLRYNWTAGSNQLFDLLLLETGLDLSRLAPSLLVPGVSTIELSWLALALWAALPLVAARLARRGAGGERLCQPHLALGLAGLALAAAMWSMKDLPPPVDMSWLAGPQGGVRLDASRALQPGDGVTFDLVAPWDRPTYGLVAAWSTGLGPEAALRLVVEGREAGRLIRGGGGDRFEARYIPTDLPRGRYRAKLLLEAPAVRRRPTNREDMQAAFFHDPEAPILYLRRLDILRPSPLRRALHRGLALLASGLGFDGIAQVERQRAALLRTGGPDRLMP